MLTYCNSGKSAKVGLVKPKSSLVEEREICLDLGIVVEQRRSAHPWGDWNWVPCAVIINADVNAEWMELTRDEDLIRYHAVTLPMTLHRKETDALRINLMQEKPELFVVMEEIDDPQSPFPYVPTIVTASSYEALDYADAGDNIVEKVFMPEAVAALIQAFVDQHYAEEKFIKRRRDRVDTEQLKFGKNPIFTPTTKH